MRTKLFGLLVIASLVLTGCAGAALAQSPTPAAPSGIPRTLSVNGSGKAFLEPDIAYIYIGVHTEGKDAAEAVAANNTQSQQLISALRDFGIAANDIQTTNFSIWPQQQYSPEGTVTGSTYVVDNTVYVTLRDLETIGDLLDTAIANGANTINGIQFDVADRTEALSDARVDAINQANAQADELAQAAGVQLGQIHSISTYGANYPGPIYADRGMGGGAAEQAASVPVSPGQLVIQVDVTVVYEIQ
jgi:uncharacterized protein YggE